MKKLFSVLIVLILFSCNSAEKVAPVFTSIDGAWRFADKNVEAEFHLITVNNKQYVDNKGWIKIKGVRYDITNRMQIPEIHPAPLRMQLTSDNARIDLTGLADSDFSKMKVSAYSYSVKASSWSTTTVNEPLTITR